MATLHLMLSEGFDPAQAEALAGALRTTIRTETPEIYCRRANGDTPLPQFIHAVAQWQLWQDTLGASATTFINRLGTRAQDIAWDEAEHLLQWPDVAPLACVAKAFATAKETLAQASNLIIGLNIPNERFGTVVVIGDSRPVKIAYRMARFVIRAEPISWVIQRAMATGEAPRGPAILTFLEDGGVQIKWDSRADMREHEARLAPS